MPIALGILKEREHWEGLNIGNYISHLVENPRVLFRYTDPVGTGLSDVIPRIENAIFELCYPAGYKTVENAMRRFQSAEQKELHNAHVKGTWSWKTYPQAVKYFLEISS